jgi:hypothetical protein
LWNNQWQWYHSKVVGGGSRRLASSNPSGTNDFSSQWKEDEDNE